MSFSDLMSSSKGPGVIGTLLALVVLVGFSTLYMFVFDEQFQGGPRIEGIIRDQQLNIDALSATKSELEMRLGSKTPFKAHAAEMALWNSRAELARQRIAELTTLRDEELETLASAEADWEAYKDNYRASEWAAAKGEKIHKLATQSGKIFQRVTIKGVSHKGMDISHEGGLRLIPCEELPAELRDRFQFDAAKTAEDAAATAAAVDLHSGNVDIVRLAEKANSKLARVRELQAMVDAKQETIEKTMKEGSSRQAALERMRIAISTEKKKKLSRAPEMEQRLRVMQAKDEQLRSMIPLLLREVDQGVREMQTLNREVVALKAEIAALKKQVETNQSTPAGP